jgi:hypothetical protein
MRQPEKRLAQHNSQFEKPAGGIVQETGQKWDLKTVIAVPDIYWAESAFWGETPFPLFYPYEGVEVERMDWPMVQKGLDAAAKAGIHSGLHLLGSLRLGPRRARGLRRTVEASRLGR